VFAAYNNSNGQLAAETGMRVDVMEQRFLQGFPRCRIMVSRRPCWALLLLVSRFSAPEKNARKRRSNFISVIFGKHRYLKYRCFSISGERRRHDPVTMHGNLSRSRVLFFTPCKRPPENLFYNRGRIGESGGCSKPRLQIKLIAIIAFGGYAEIDAAKAKGRAQLNSYLHVSCLLHFTWPTV
jgi:hypothetical protein